MQACNPLPCIFSFTILSVNLFIFVYLSFLFVSTLYTRDLILSIGFLKKIKKFLFFSRVLYGAVALGLGMPYGAVALA